jgi:preprotein translocase subunit SecE
MTPGAKELQVMATKAAIANGEERPSPAKRQEPGSALKLVGSVRGVASDFIRFLHDVRAEMRKVVTPSRKEVQATTTVVIVAVFIFGLYFFVVDLIFQNGLHALLGRLGGF